jgi:FAD/FMN-containing dehydrogenase
VHALKVARAWNVPVSVRGTGHSCGGQALCEGGIVIANVARNGDVAVAGDDSVDVSARTTWAALERALNERGRTVPVLTNNRESTVGGTLAVGGYGPRSIAHGAQIDHVRRLRLIEPDGTVGWCSPTERPELFRFSLAGLGQVGVIERVVLRTEPYRPILRMQTNVYDRSADLVDAIAWTSEWVEPSPDHLTVHLEGRSGRCQSVFASGFERREDAIFSPVPAPLRRMPDASVRIARWPQVTADAHDPRYRSFWGDYCFDLDGLRAFARFIDAGFRGGGMDGNRSNTFLYCLRRPPVESRWPFDMRSIGGSGRNLYGFGLHYRIDRDDEPRIAASRTALRSALDACLALGGRPYLYGWHELDERVRRQLYGREYDRLLELRRQLDPNGLLNRHALNAGGVRS